MLPIAAPVAVGTADEDVAEELHFDFFEACAAAAFALALAGIEAESAGVQAALLRRVRLCEEFPDIIESSDVNRGIRARRLAENRLVDEHDALEGFAAEKTCG